MEINHLVNSFCDYSRFIKGYSKNTIRNYKIPIRLLVAYAKIESISEISDAHVQGFFVHGRSDKNWTPRTFISYYHSLTVFFRWCVKNGHLFQSPLSSLELPKVGTTVRGSLSREKAMKLLEIVFNYPYDNRYLRCRNHAIFSMFIFAGLRKAELLSLRLTDVDIENQSIFVHKGKGNKDRVVPMSSTLAESLRRYLAEREREGKTCVEFFTSSIRNCGFREIGLNRLVEKMRTVSNISFTAHALRRTFATLMYEGGCDVVSLSRMLGHSDIKVTLLYVQSSVEYLRSHVLKHPLNGIHSFA